MKTIYVNNVLRQISECERLANLYNQLYELLTCPGFEQIDMPVEERIEIDLCIIKGEIINLKQLGEMFDKLADQQYIKANNLLKTDFKRAI